MDPVTIVVTTVSSVKIAIQVSALLYTFVIDTSQTDTALRSLATELDGFKNAMFAIDQCLRSPSLLIEQSAEDEHRQELILSINQSLENCQKPLHQFEQLLIKVKGTHAEANSFRKSMIQIKRNLKTDDIKNYRFRISTHSLAMQMSLRTLTL